MITTIKDNPKLAILGVVAVAASTIMADPTLIGDLPKEVQAYVKAFAFLVVNIAGYFGFMAIPNKKISIDSPIEPPAPKAEVVKEKD